MPSAFDRCVGKPPSVDQRLARRSQPRASLPYLGVTLATYLQRTVGNQAMLRLVGRTNTGEGLGPHQALAVQRSPGSWAASPTVARISGYSGSEEYWQPVRGLVDQYSLIDDQEVEDRREILAKLSMAIRKWRDHQAKNLWDSSLDKKKAKALLELEGLMKQEIEELNAPSRRIAGPSRPTMSSAPMAIGSRASSQSRNPIGPSSSFLDALASTPQESHLGLTRHVQQKDVAPLGNQQKCRVTVAADGKMMTHDGLYSLDSEGEWVRYVMLIERDATVFYASQVVAEADAGKIGWRGFVDYPVLTSHAQIAGTVVAAGDMVVNEGRVQEITNQSGTWQPSGKHLALVLKRLVRMGIVGEDALVAGRVTVQQFISRPEGYDIDAGHLVQIMGDAMNGKLT